MRRAYAILSGVLVTLIVIGTADLVHLPPLLMWIGVFLIPGVGLASGFVVGVVTRAGWRARTRTGALAGALSGFAFGYSLWASMSHWIPRAEYSVFWAINYVIAVHPVGIGIAPWLYTGNTLMGPVIAISTLVFAVEGYVAGGAVAGGESVVEPPSAS